MRNKFDKLSIKRALLIVGVSLLALLFSACNQLQPPRIELNVNQFDLGDIDPDKGKITKTFRVANRGGNTLKIWAVATSCGCTRAAVKSKEIASGEETELTVTYDPSVHPGFVGKIKRVVYIQSNDPIHEEVELRLTGNSLASKQKK